MYSRLLGAARFWTVAYVQPSFAVDTLGVLAIDPQAFAA